ncbi:MAG TPA: PAS domain-containing protein [Blastocatellia bacterium]
MNWILGGSNRHFSFLSRVKQLARSNTSVGEAVQSAADEIGVELHADRLIILAYRENEVILAGEYAAPGVQSLSSQTLYTVDEEIIGFLRSLTEPLESGPQSDLQGPPASLLKLLAEGHQGGSRPVVLVVPIQVDPAVSLGLIYCRWGTRRSISEQEKAMLDAAGAYIALALNEKGVFEQSRLKSSLNQAAMMEKARDAARREALTTRIIKLINQSALLDGALPALARELGHYLACDTLMIASVRDGGDSWAVECQFRDGVTVQGGESYRSSDFGLLIDCLRHEPMLCEDVEADDRLHAMLDTHFRPAGTRALMVVPVSNDGALRLAIIAVMRSGPRKWTAEEAEILRTAADQVLVALQRTELFEQVSLGKQDWEATFEALSDGVFIFDGNKKLRRVNSAGAQLEGAPSGDLIGREFCALLQESDGDDGDACRVGPVIATGAPVTFELTHRRLSRPLLVTVSRVRDEEAASAAGRDGAVCIVRDLSELRAAEAVAREQRSFLAKLIEHASDAIAAISPDGKFIWFNEQLLHLAGYTRAELFGSDSKRLLARGEEDPAMAKFKKALTGEAQTFEMRGLRKSGEIRLLLTTYTPIFDRGRVSSVLCMARDITQERVAAGRAAQADKLRALGQLASGVAHNFNNVLAAIVGHAQLTRRDVKDERLLRRLEVIEQAALDGAQTVKRIQGFAVQQKDEAFQPIDINGLVQDSANLTRARWADDAQANGLNYEVELDLQPLPLTKGSASELREVFVNIILNALDAMPQGGRLSMRTEPVDSAVKISFSDTGVGMSRPISQRIFEPFFTTKGTNGMGLGLAVSSSIIERHGGQIEAASNPGRGSVFTVSIPVTYVEYRGNGRTPRHIERAVNILVIDDDPLVRQALVEMLVSEGHKAESAAGGAEGLLKLESGGFDLLLTDLSMPEMDGLAVASDVRRRWPNIKIVLVTGYILPSQAQAHDKMIDAFLVKPVKVDDLTRTLDEVLPDQGPRVIRPSDTAHP